MTVTRTEVGECRQCRAFCDKMVEPRGCIELGCRYLYSYVDRLSGEQYVGCVQEGFSAEIELGPVLGPGGVGGVKMTGEPRPHCQFTVERAYEGEGESYGCVNRRFFDCADSGAEGLRAFDLRDVRLDTNP